MRREATRMLETVAALQSRFKRRRTIKHGSSAPLNSSEGGAAGQLCFVQNHHQQDRRQVYQRHHHDVARGCGGLIFVHQSNRAI
jgi:hypothetical protein